MSAAVSMGLASLVYGVMRLSSEDGLGLAPKRVTRVMGIGSIVVLLLVSRFDPPAFQDGLSQFSEWSQSRMMEPYQEMIFVNQRPLPTHSDPPNRALGEMRPIR